MGKRILPNFKIMFLQSSSNWSSLRVAQKERKWPQIQTSDSHAHTGTYEQDK